ncbi:helicase-exonuclease AddAB subunit AddA [uncultured Clostridium sp.]|uniref:helicase-exonuclease AddAB subunit AddA n=1 Tax=uncultured Clostridium sp. TaxID=59620 RepID=UPI002607956F|nr:helicase-exonuclease AddAB subunit AddA [uncultured Clostridium sp.]
MGDTWTDEQKQAIYTRDCNLLVAAAAGSGKTAVLVERIIKMLTEGEALVDIDKLLVVTFTNAAAAEMRERIGDAISKALEEKPDSEVLQRQLSLLSKSNIMTMHSFCLNIIRANYHLLDLDPGFRISDDAEASIIKDDIIAELLEDKYEEQSKPFLDLIDAFASGNNDEKIKEEILGLYRFVMSGPSPEKWLMEKAEEYNVYDIDALNKTKWVETIIETLSDEIYNAINVYQKLIDICIGNSWLEPYKETLDSDLAYINNVKHTLSSNDIGTIYEALGNIEFVRIKTIKKALVEDINLKDEIKAARDGLKKEITKLIESVPSDNIDEIIKGINYMYPIIKCLGELVIDFKNRFSEKKKEKNILDFNDIEHLSLKVLVDDINKGENANPTAIAKEFKEKFVEVLVDEYQDSSSIQEKIVDMVSRRTDPKNPNAFMVGDVKQSIYKFRQAKPELFLDKYNKYGEDDGDKNRKIMLFKNFRSRKEVLSSANYIFETLMSEKIGELEYDEKERLNLGIPYSEIEGNVVEEESHLNSYNLLETELHIFDKSGSPIDEEKSYESSSEDEGEDSDKGSNDEADLEDSQFEARIIAKRIQELMSGADGKNYVVWDKGLKKYRKLKYKDIVILLRATKAWSGGIVEELGNVGIPVYADTGTGYFDTTEIRTIMSFLNIIDNPMQDIYLIASLRSPVFSFTAEELGEVRLIEKGKYFYENVQKIYNGETSASDELVTKCKYFIDKLNLWRDRSEYTPIDELVWFLYTDTAYFGYVGAMPNGPQRQANLKILFQRAKQYEETSFKGVFNFINFINKMRKSSNNDLGSAKILGENEDVVRIMSIHKSKGLEFPVVFLAATGKQFNMMDLNKNILYHEEFGIGVDVVNVDTHNRYTGIAKTAIKNKAKLEILSEEMRILYVALTRAREKLIIIGGLRDVEKKFAKWYEAGTFSEGSKIDPSKLTAKNGTYIDWIGMAMSKHPDGGLIREGKEIINTGDMSKWELKVWQRADLLETAKEEKEEKDVLDLEKAEVEIGREILERLNFNYKFEGVCNIPSNISVSDLKKKALDDENVINLFKDEELESFNMPLDLSKDDITLDIENDALEEVAITKFETDENLPSFMREKKGITPAERGTIMHFVMMHLNFDETSVSDIRKLVGKMVIKELLTDEEADTVNAFKISNFFKSEIGKRLLRARENGYKIYRELPFFREYKVIDLYDDLDKEIYKDEMLRLQGIIDCFFEDENGVVIIDYKTDYVEVGEEDKLLTRYKIQIDLYSQTLERILGKKVTEMYLYLFGLDKEIKY